MSLIGEHTCRGEAETAALAARLAGLLQPGDWVLLTGALARARRRSCGARRGAGDRSGPRALPDLHLRVGVSGPRRLAHVDLYRVDEVRELDELGLDDLRERRVIVAVEWASGSRRVSLPEHGT